MCNGLKTINSNYIYAPAHAHTRIHTHIHAYTYTHIHTYTHTYIHTYTDTHTHTWADWASKYTYTQN